MSGHVVKTRIIKANYSAHGPETVALLKALNLDDEAVVNLWVNASLASGGLFVTAEVNQKDAEGNFIVTEICKADLN